MVAFCSDSLWRVWQDGALNNSRMSDGKGMRDMVVGSVGRFLQKGMGGPLCGSGEND